MYRLIRDTTEDVILNATRETGESVPVPVRKGTRIVVDVVGIREPPLIPVQDYYDSRNYLVRLQPSLFPRPRRVPPLEVE